jgi:hypothetical protein
MPHVPPPSTTIKIKNTHDFTKHIYDFHWLYSWLNKEGNCELSHIPNAVLILKRLRTSVLTRLSLLFPPPLNSEKLVPYPRRLSHYVTKMTAHNFHGLSETFNTWLPRSLSPSSSMLLLTFLVAFFAEIHYKYLFFNLCILFFLLFFLRLSLSSFTTSIRHVFEKYLGFP